MFMRIIIAGLLVCFAPSLALAQDAVFGNSYYDYQGEPKSEIERSVRQYERQQIAEQAQRDYYYQQEETDRQKEIIKELRELNDNQRRAMGETVYPRFKD